MTHQELTDLLPTEFMWGDSLQPHHLQEILQAATAKADARIKELEVLLPPKLTETLTHERNCPAWHDVFGLETDAEKCTCGYKWRVYLQTEQQMHNAWRKRAEEAEQQLSAKDEVIAQCEEVLKVNDQAILEIVHALREPEWFTGGEYKARQHYNTWIHKREIATQEALAAIAKHKESDHE